MSHRCHLKHPKSTISQADLVSAENTLWHFLNDDHRAPLQPCQWLIGLGCADERVARHSAHLFLAGYAEALLFSGGHGRLTQDCLTQTEAEHFSAVAQSQGVPKHKIHLETQASNTAQNCAYSIAMLADLPPEQPLLLVCRNLYRPRVAATFAHQFPDRPFLLSSPALDYPTFAASATAVSQSRHLMVGEIERLLHYPARGWLKKRPLPANVIAAYRTLLQAGYHEYCVSPKVDSP